MEKFNVLKDRMNALLEEAEELREEFATLLSSSIDDDEEAEIKNHFYLSNTNDVLVIGYNKEGLIISSANDDYTDLDKEETLPYEACSYDDLYEVCKQVIK